MSVSGSFLKPEMANPVALPTLILGIGNILLQDEGVGVRVIEAMSRCPLPPGVEVVDGGTAGADLVELMADRQKVIVIDAMQSEAPPGTIMRFHGEDVTPQEGAKLSLHELGLAESLRIATLLGCAPRQVVVFGIQPAVVAPGLDLTPELAAAVPWAVQAVIAELKKTADVFCSPTDRRSQPCVQD